MHKSWVKINVTECSEPKPISNSTVWPEWARLAIVLQRGEVLSTAPQSPERAAVGGGGGATTRQIARGSGRCRARNSANARRTCSSRGFTVRGFTSQLLSSIEAGGGDRGFWLKLPRTSLARSSQLRRGHQGDLVGRGRILGRRAECA